MSREVVVCDGCFAIVGFIVVVTILLAVAVWCREKRAFNRLVSEDLLEHVAVSKHVSGEWV